jgi:hypothetical protein
LSQLILPDSLRSLVFGDEFDQSLAGFTFPPLIEEINLGWYFNQSLGVSDWSPPPQLNSLHLPGWDQTAADLYLPPSLISLKCYSKFSALPISALFPLLPAGLHQLHVPDGWITPDELIALKFPHALHTFQIGIRFIGREGDAHPLDVEIHAESFEFGDTQRTQLIERIEFIPHAQEKIYVTMRSTPKTHCNNHCTCVK